MFAAFLLSNLKSVILFFYDTKNNFLTYSLKTLAVNIFRRYTNRSVLKKTGGFTSCDKNIFTICHHYIH